MFAVFHYEDREHRTGITTELAAIAVFLLALLAASWRVPFAMPLAIGTAIIAAAFLEARERLHKLLRETITEAEFNATLALRHPGAGDLSAAAGGRISARTRSSRRARCGCLSF